VDNATETVAPAESYRYKRLTDADRITILALDDKGLTQTAIAQRLDRSVSTINDVLQTYGSTVDIAKRKLAAAAGRMADNVIDKGLPRDHVKTLEGLGVLAAQTSQGFTLILNGLTIHGTGRSEAVEGEVLSPSTPEAESESR
jgi:helix-turn-helix protein